MQWGFHRLTLQSRAMQLPWPPKDPNLSSDFARSQERAVPRKAKYGVCRPLRPTPVVSESSASGERVRQLCKRCVWMYAGPSELFADFKALNSGDELSIDYFRVDSNYPTIGRDPAFGFRRFELRAALGRWDQRTCARIACTTAQHSRNV